MTENQEQKVYIVSFSGGKDSTAMLLLLIEKGYPIDEIVCCDTGLEFKDMYDHIEKVKKNINMPITVLKAEKDFEYYLLEHEISKGYRKGEKGYDWPYFRNRWCTGRLKGNLVDKYLREKYPKDKYEIWRYHGIALDEPARTEKNKHLNVLYPLVEWGMEEKDCLQYCYDNGYDWNGLYEKFDRVSCWCCPLKNLKELKVLYYDFPDYWNQLKEWDSKTRRKFRPDYSVEQLEEKFKREKEKEKEKETE